MHQDDYQKYLKIRTDVRRVVEKCEDLFESRIIYIGSGALGISFTVLSFAGQDGAFSCRWLIAVSWASITLSIMINLYLQLYSRAKANAVIREIDRMVGKNIPFDAQSINDIIAKRNSRIDWVNKSSLISLVSGIAGILVFMLINFI